MTGPLTSRASGSANPTSRAWQLGAVLGSIACLVLQGCGATSNPPVAHVQDTAITRSALAHWMSVYNAPSPIPVPDPPRYDGCIAAASAEQVGMRRRPLMSRPALRARCAVIYTKVRNEALAFLITAKWLTGEAAARGITVSPGEADATYRRMLAGPAGRSFAMSLARRGISSADETLQLRLDKLALKLRAQLSAGYTGAQATRRIATFIAAYRQRWRLRTTCEPGYLVPECRNGQPLPPPAGG
jgi:hypothetical protein